MKLIVQEGFKWAHRGVEVEEFEAGAGIQTEDEDLINVSTSEGWTVEAGAASLAAEPAGEPLADETPATEGPDTTQAPTAQKRGRAKQ